MPYPIEQNSNGQYCVMGPDGAVMKCYATEREATNYQRALYASESKSTGIEIDALKSSGQRSAVSGQPGHTHAPLKSFIATPRTDPTLMERFRSLWKSELKPGQYITKGADGLRYMFIITSNSYIDRDDEVITSKALEQYEASCYPGDDLFYCDNPLLWWHDDDIPMGEIVAVNYSKPFLVEVAKELPSPTARVLWDYAEQNGDKAGASHRFGYRDEDRKPDGSYTQIVKQETSYLPERELAANIMTYAGVIDKNMSTSQSDKRINEVFAAATAGKIQEAAAKIHAKSGEIDKELAALGITHKAKAEGDKPEEEPKLDADGNPMPPEEEQKQGIPAEFTAWIERLLALQAMITEMTGAQDSMMGDMDSGMEQTAALAKELKALKDENVQVKSHNDTLEQRIAVLEARAKLTPRKASTDPETNITAAELKALHEQAEKASVTTHPAFGVAVDPSKNPFKRNGAS